MASILDKRVTAIFRMHSDRLRRQLGRMDPDPYHEPVDDEQVLGWIRHLSRYDPTAPKFEFLDWLTTRWLSGSLPDDDLWTVKETLEQFLEKRPGLPADKRDIDAYGYLVDLEDTLAPFRPESEHP